MPGEMVISRGFFGTHFFSRDEIAFPMRLGMDSQCFAINETLRELRKGGVIAHLQEQWLTQSPPPDMERITLISAGVLLFLLAHVVIFFYYRGRNLRLRVLAESELHYRHIIEQSPMAIGIQRRGVILYRQRRPRAHVRPPFAARPCAGGPSLASSPKTSGSGSCGSSRPAPPGSPPRTPTGPSPSAPTGRPSRPT